MLVYHDPGRQRPYSSEKLNIMGSCIIYDVIPLIDSDFSSQRQRTTGFSFFPVIDVIWHNNILELHWCCQIQNTKTIAVK